MLAIPAADRRDHGGVHQIEGRVELGLGHLQRALGQARRPVERPAVAHEGRVALGAHGLDDRGDLGGELRQVGLGPLQQVGARVWVQIGEGDDIHMRHGANLRGSGAGAPVISTSGTSRARPAGPGAQSRAPRGR